MLKPVEMKTGRHGKVMYHPINPIVFPERKTAQSSPLPSAGLKTAEMIQLIQGDLLRKDGTEKTTLGIFINARTVTSLVPGGYPSVALGNQINVGDVIVSVNGQSVTDQTIMTNIKRTRDAVGGKVHLGLHCARTGHRKEAVLIRQRASHLTHYEKVFRALSELENAAALQFPPPPETPPRLITEATKVRMQHQSAFKALSQELSAMISALALDESALGDKLFALQQQVERQIGDLGASQAAAPAAPGSSKNAGLEAQNKSLQKELAASAANLAAMTQRAKEKELAASAANLAAMTQRAKEADASLRMRSTLAGAQSASHVDTKESASVSAKDAAQLRAKDEEIAALKQLVTKLQDFTYLQQQDAAQLRAKDEEIAALKQLVTKLQDFACQEQPQEAGGEAPAQEEVMTLKAEVAKLRSELSEALKGKTPQKADQPATSGLQMAKELDAAKAEVQRLQQEKRAVEKELEAKSMALDVASFAQSKATEAEKAPAHALPSPAAAASKAAPAAGAPAASAPAPAEAAPVAAQEDTGGGIEGEGEGEEVEEEGSGATAVEKKKKKKKKK